MLRSSGGGREGGAEGGRDIAGAVGRFDGALEDVFGLGDFIPHVFITAWLDRETYRDRLKRCREWRDT